MSVLGAWTTVYGESPATRKQRPCSVCEEPITAPYAWRNNSDYANTKEEVERVHLQCAPAVDAEHLLTNYISWKLLR